MHLFEKQQKRVRAFKLFFLVEYHTFHRSAANRSTLPQELSLLDEPHLSDAKATFTRYRTNFRPVENSYTYGFRSHGTKLNVRKLTRFAVQKFERQNRGRIFSRCSRKFDRCALKTSEHHKRPIFFTVKAWLRECEAAQLEEESTEAAILIALLGNIRR